MVYQSFPLFMMNDKNYIFALTNHQYTPKKKKLKYYQKKK